MIQKVKIVGKSWGKEEWFANNETEDYCGKVLTILKDQSTSMHYHADKHETFYVLEGTLQVDWIDTKEGNCKHNYNCLWQCYGNAAKQTT